MCAGGGATDKQTTNMDNNFSRSNSYLPAKIALNFSNVDGNLH